jgi:hypothetical protein
MVPISDFVILKNKVVVHVAFPTIFFDEGTVGSRIGSEIDFQPGRLLDGINSRWWSVWTRD